MRLKTKLGGLLFLAAGMRAWPAFADEEPSKQACHAAYEQGQRLRKHGQLLEARDNFLRCAQAPCPAVFQPECASWLSEVERVLPSIVVRVESRGEAEAIARVFVDGHLVAEKLDGRAISVNPGSHELRVEPLGRAPSQRTMLFNEGDRARPIVFAYPASSSPLTPAGPMRPVPAGATAWLPYAAAGIGVVALGSFAYFGLTGANQWSDLKGCGAHCPPSDIDSTRTHFLVADISLGVSVVALGIAAYLFVREASAPPSPAP